MSWAEDYLTIPWRDGGRDAKGCDCWGLVRLILAERAGVASESFSTLSALDRPGAEGAFATARRSRDWVEVTDRAAVTTFDAVLMRNGASLSHCGLVVAPGRLIHMERSAGRPTIAGFSDPMVARRIHSFWRRSELARGVEADPADRESGE